MTERSMIDTLMDPDRMLESNPDGKAIARSIRKGLKRRHHKAEAETAVQRFPKLEPRNETQADYIDSIDTCEQVICIGPAGTGKTYIAARRAMRMLIDKKITHIMLARPAVAKQKHRLGFRPGDQNEKIADWMVPIMQGFKSEAPAQAIQSLQQQGRIEFLAFETLRGRSLENAFIIMLSAERMGSRPTHLVDRHP